jgi:hypothetical protein
VWRKHFRSLEELTEDLEEYGIWRSAQRVATYGERTGGEDDLPEDAQELVEVPSSKTERIMQAMSEIDLRMDVLRVEAWHWYRIIDTYYRSGLSVQRDGWMAAAEYCGLHHSSNSKGGVDRRCFFEELEVAVKKLWHTRVR